MKLDITEQMLFALLRSALHGTHADATIFAGITSEAWQECYRLSVRQGVMALAWDGLITLPTVTTTQILKNKLVAGGRKM